MKTTRIVLLAVLLLGAFAAASSAQTSIAAGIHVGPSGRAAVDVGFFYDDLAPYGNWVDRPSHGWCWVPHHRQAAWRPYKYGHWVDTDEGWTWISDEPYGWATYHYGRWYLDPDYGWEWIPGNQWAPAWVSFQEGNDYVGWAPLPPSVEFNGNYGVDYGSVGFSASLTPEDYLFVPERQFLAPRVYDYAVSDFQAPVIYRQTRNFTNYRFANDRFINQGIPVDRIQRVVGRTLPRYQIADLAPNQRHQGARIAQNRLELFRPQVQRAASVAPPPSRPIARRAVMTAAAAAVTVKAAHAAHQAYLAHAAAAGRAPQGTARQQQLQARQAQQGRQQQQQQARQAQQARQQQLQARGARQDRQQQQQLARQTQQNRQQQQLQARNARQNRQQQQQQARQAQQNRQQQQLQARNARQNRQQQQQQARQAQQGRQQQQLQARNARQNRQQQQQQARQAQQGRQQQQQARQNRQQQQPRPQRQAQAQNNRPRGGQGQPQGNPRNRRQQDQRPPNGPGQ
jgi:hypothetical protein